MKKYFLVLVLTIQGALVLIIDNYLDRRNKEKLDQFKHNVSELLGNSKTVVVPAYKLTDFSWNIICFNRSNLIKLKFISKYSKLVLYLDYKNYYIDEAYYKGSLEGKCISNKDNIIIKNIGYIKFLTTVK